MTDETNQTNDAPSWYIDDGVPGVGQRPAWMPEKYKTAADLAKAHAELEKKLGTAPEDYDFTKSKYLDPDYAPFQELKNLAKERRVSKDVMDKVIDSVDKYMDEFKTDYSEEFKKLGENAKDRVDTVNNWAKANLSKEAYAAIRSSIKNADGFKALEELRGRMMSNTPQVPNGNENSLGSTASVDDLKLELANNLDKYKNDEAYRKDYQNRLSIAAKNATGYVDKIGA